jgi:glycylpeptide N-tetradecanoyltransferase
MVFYLLSDSNGLPSVIPVSEINYLCVHKKLRSKRLAPVLIKEVTRQVHLTGVFQAIYTAGVVIPTPVSVCRYYHRSLNVPKLIETKFSYVPRNMTLARLIRVNKLESKTTLAGLREMEEKDLPQVADLFRRYMQRFDMAPLMNFEEVKHHLLSGRGEGEVGDGGKGRRKGQVTWSFVVEVSFLPSGASNMSLRSFSAQDPQTHLITEFFSFYSLPSTIINNTKYPTLEAAYLYYYATETAFEPESEISGQLKKKTQSLIGDALIIANEAGFDVFNALTLMDNVPIMQDLKVSLPNPHCY